ncbi:CRTAC1 family protein [Olleya aquimaris]|uniref:CRTAC1 family protein n=1 Tax=Olleya sediminilitoris TaxID=2795739 RepID=A0ABS1WNK1_9FLAO|nr:CRTAC1 family protein [Olleya sediminilitoris]AXO80956.1 CRTAC1 family protein [Olleya aquimaris]MBL7560674.1 CRTAC1 family protein [Olleya sediminilitoris]
MLNKCIFYKILFLIFLIFSCNKQIKENISPKKHLFKVLSPENTGVKFTNQLKEDANHSIINYIYFYNGNGLCAGDINNDGLTDLYFVSNQGENKLYLNKGNFKFEDITKKANIESLSDWNTGATMVDINNDGFMDIYLCSVSGILDFEGRNELFINNGNGTFTEKAKDYGLDFKGYSTQSYFFDYDKDDDLDVYIVNHAVHTNLSYGPASHRKKRVGLVGDVLLKNTNGKFIDVSETSNIFGGPNGYGLSASIGDFNNDGWDDIYVCNDFHEDDYYYLNNQDGTFTEKMSEAFSTISRFSMGSDSADINGDGFLDIITLDMLPEKESIIKQTEGDDAMYNMQKQLKKLGYKDQISRNMLQINNNGSYFIETASYNHIEDTDWSWGPLFADFDNDGFQDLFISNGILRRPNNLDFRKYVSSTFKQYGSDNSLKWLYKSLDKMPSGASSNRIFKGNSQSFEDKTGKWIEDKPSFSNGAIYLDLDLDGDLDIVTNNLNEKATILKNTTDNSNNYLSIKFNYKPSNKEGLGTKAIVYSNGLKQFKQLYKTRGFLSAGEGKLHFGLEKNVIDSLHIIWPNNKVQKINDVSINTNLTVDYKIDTTPYSYINKKEKNFFKRENILDFVHSEDNYDDFFHERLIPNRVSIQGPAVAIADIDNNGFEDFFIGNASGKKAKLFLNNGFSFKEKKITHIEQDLLYEDNVATFFDADGDSDLDLYVGSGIELLRRKNFENDRLYINNNNSFEKSNNTIPNNFNNTSSVVAYDYDQDGDQDLFIGNLSNPNSYGDKPSAYILINDGKGNFSKDKEFNLNIKATAATWSDINNDGIKDLLIASEWDSPKIYINNKGNLKPLDIPNHLNGLWQSITTFDIDDDGDLDILLGNWGENTRFNEVSSDAPLKLYYSDFDSNGTKETVLAYKKDNNYYPVNSKDELASQMNIISKRFINYKDFSSKPIEDVLTYESLKKGKIYKVETLSSGYIQNNNGNFNTFIEFNYQLQLAPINSFAEITINNKKGLVVSGNSNKTGTYHGAYLALKGMFLETDNQINQLSNYGIDAFNGQVKQTGVIKMKNKNLFFVLTNNEAIKTYTFR